MIGLATMSSKYPINIIGVVVTLLRYVDEVIGLIESNFMRSARASILGNIPR
jgi:hypothetical protein